MMDARKQATVAPLLFVDARKEASAQNRAFAFQRGQRSDPRPRLKSERRRQRRLRDGPKTLEPAAQNLDQRLVARPLLSGLVSGRCDVRFEQRLWRESPELAQALGWNPEPSLRRLQES